VYEVEVNTSAEAAVGKAKVVNDEKPEGLE
jgi:hypothetical protein